MTLLISAAADARSARVLRWHEERQALRELVGALGAESLITFLGYVEPAEPLYHAWDSGVLKRSTSGARPRS